jgi:hypothetical protein
MKMAAGSSVGTAQEHKSTLAQQEQEGAAASSRGSSSSSSAAAAAVAASGQQPGTMMAMLTPGRPMAVTGGLARLKRQRSGGRC